MRHYWRSPSVVVIVVTSRLHRQWKAARLKCASLHNIPTAAPPNRRAAQQYGHINSSHCGVSQRLTIFFTANSHYHQNITGHNVRSATIANKRRSPKAHKAQLVKPQRRYSEPAACHKHTRHMHTHKAYACTSVSYMGTGYYSVHKG